jgi:Red chlorophyll catabolite reductase (RCC reductase)
MLCRVSARPPRLQRAQLRRSPTMSASRRDDRGKQQRNTLLGEALQNQQPQQRDVDTLCEQLRNALLVDGLERVKLAFPAMKETRTRHHVHGDAGVPYSSLDGHVAGRVRTYAGGPISHCVVADIWSPTRSFGAMRLDVFLDGSVPAPHLLLHLNLLPPSPHNANASVLFYFDLQPRVDLRSDEAYMTRYYMTPVEGGRSPAALVAACLANDRLRPYISRDGVVRVFMGTPAALLFTIDADAEGVQILESILEEMLSIWIALATMPRAAQVDATTVRQRDRITRLFVQRDPDTANMRPLLGKETTEMLIELLSGIDTNEA